jgi:hypothetical protein
MNSLVGFAPPNHFEGLATGDTSWVFDATGLGLKPVWLLGCVSTRCLNLSRILLRA